MAKSRALQVGILSAIVGGLKFKLDEEAEQRRAAAEELKMQRLEQIQIERERRAEQDAIEGELRDELRDERDARRAHVRDKDLREIDAGISREEIELRGQVQERVANSTAATGHQYDTIDREDRQQHDVGMVRAQLAADQERHKLEAQQGKIKIFGSDNMLHDPGTLPPGVTARSIVNQNGSVNMLPADSKTDAPGYQSTRPGAARPPTATDRATLLRQKYKVLGIEGQ